MGIQITEMENVINYGVKGRLATITLGARGAAELSGKKLKEGFIGQQSLVVLPGAKKEMLRNPLTNGLFLTAIGYYPTAVNHYRERRKGCQDYILLYCTAGKGYVRLRKSTYELSPNSFFIVPKNVAHQYGASAQEPWSIHWVHFSGTQADALFARYTRNGMPAVMLVASNEARTELLSQMFGLLQRSAGARGMELLSINVLQLLSSLIYQSELDTCTTRVDRIAASIQFMKDKVHQRYNVLELARMQGLSVSRYIELFKKKTGVTPITYFNQLKVQKSCEFLQYTDTPIKEISAKIGFDDPYYFSRMFKGVTNVSPAAYRKKFK